MKRSLLGVGIGLFPFFFLPTGVALVVDAFWYASVLWYSYVFDQPNLLIGILTSAYLILASLYHFLGLTDVAPYTGAVIYGSFSLAFFYRGIFLDGERQRIAWVQSGLTALAVFLSFRLSPSPSYVYVPLGISLLALQWGKQRESELHFLQSCLPVYERGGFRAFIIQTAEQMAAANRIIEACYPEIYLKSELRRSREVGLKEFFRRCRFSRAHGSSVSFLFTDAQNRPLGCATVYTDEKNELPLEHELKMELDWLRNHLGKLAEVGRLAVMPEGRHQGGLWECMFRAIAHHCIDQEVVFLVCQAVEQAYPLYQKIGFIPFLKNSAALMDEEFKVPCVPCYLNLTRKIKAALAVAKRSSPSSRSGKTLDYLDKVSARQINGIALPLLIALPEEALAATQTRGERR